MTVPSCIANRLGALALLVTLMLSATAAHAGDAALAQELFDEGQALIEAGNVEEACKKFAASMEAEPSGGTALNLGRCHEKLGRPASAWAEYKRAIPLLRAGNEEGRLEFAEEQAARIAPTLSKLTIDAAPTPGLVVEKDGVVVAEGALGSPAPVDPGERVISASAEGYKPWSTTLSVGVDADTYTVSIPPLEELPPDAISPGPAAEEGSSTLVITGAVLAGVGGVAAIAGGVLGGTVLSDASTLDAECGSEVVDGKRLCEGEADDTRRSAETKALASNILIIGGSVIAAGGVVLLIVGLMDDGPDEGDAMAVVPIIGPSEVGLGFSARF